MGPLITDIKFYDSFKRDPILFTLRKSHAIFQHMPPNFYAAP